MKTRFGSLDAVVEGPEAAAVTAVLLHGIGLGEWLWDPWIPAFTAAGVRTVALRLPGHGPERDVGFDEVVAEVSAALDAIGGPVALVGHSMGGLVAQVIAARRPLASLALVCPLPPGQVRLVPPRTTVRRSVGLLPALLTGRPVKVPWPLYRAVGLDRMDEPAARAAYARIVAWPNRLCRDIARARPVVDPAAVTAPVLVVLGGKDSLVPWDRARVLGDLYEAVTWRYDDVGHMAPHEPAGARMGVDLARWVASPTRPQVLESEGFGPAEGVGHTLRRERRGEEMKRRSAYGQKRSARGS